MTAARFALTALLVALALNSASAAGRDLLQSGVSCPNQIPTCTARRCTTRILDSKETYVCLRCQNGYIPVKGSDGKSIVQCVCPTGTYELSNTTGSGSSARTVRACVKCPVGSFCPGGNPKARRPTDNRGEVKSCNPQGQDGLTTKSESSTRPGDCIAEAGYVLPSAIGGAAQTCSGNTYAPANNRLKTCLPCQSGLAVPANYSGPHANKNDVCQVPPGKFWELNVVRDCPKGLYRSNFVRTDDKLAIACLSCPEGWTTPNIASESIRNCSVLLPGYKVTDVPAGNTTTDIIDTTDDSFVPPPTEACPIGYYSDGSNYGCTKCPFSATTLKNGSTSADDCMVPPGYFASSSNNSLVQCPTTPEGDNSTEGYYRPGWKIYKEVIDTDGTTVCIPCGDGILSRPRDADELPGAAADSLVPASTASCFIKGGWGITFDPEDYTKFKAIIPCPANTYGVADEVYGLINAPCKACTKNLYSLAASTSFDDCMNPGGFGYTSEGANQCPDGFWAAKDSMAPCEQCPEGRTTLYQPGNGTLQDSIDDCFVVPGSGVFDGNSSDPWNPSNPDSNTPAKPCPTGFYSNVDTLTNSTKCQQCPGSSTTVTPGSTSCNACKAGFGKANTTAPCSECDFGSFSFGQGDSCSLCPNTVFNDFVGDGYTSYGITVRKASGSDAACVPRYAQLPKPVGDRMGLPDAMFTEYTLSASSDNLKVKQCVEACPADRCCVAEMEKPENGDLSCKHAMLTPVAASADTAKMFYKLPPSEFAAANVDDDDDTTLQAKTIASGLYAICSVNATAAQNGEIGTSNDPTKVEAGRNYIEFGQCADLASCKAACDKDATCWGFVQVPGVGFALRGGESWLGGRTFFASPDGKDFAGMQALAW